MRLAVLVGEVFECDMPDIGETKAEVVPRNAVGRGSK